MKTKGVRTLKNGTIAGYVLQKDGSWKWRFIKGSSKKGGENIQIERINRLKRKEKDNGTLKYKLENLKSSLLQKHLASPKVFGKHDNRVYKGMYNTLNELLKNNDKSNEKKVNDFLTNKRVNRIQKSIQKWTVNKKNCGTRRCSKQRVASKLIKNDLEEIKKRSKKTENTQNKKNNNNSNKNKNQQINTNSLFKRQNGTVDSVYNRIKRVNDGLFVVKNGGGRRVGINKKKFFANQCFYISISDWLIMNDDKLTSIDELKNLISANGEYLLNPNSRNTSLTNPQIIEAIDNFCDKNNLRIIINRFDNRKNDVLPIKYPLSTTYQPNKTNDDTKDIPILWYGNHFELIVYSNKINYNKFEDKTRVFKTIDDYLVWEKRKILDFVFFMKNYGKISKRVNDNNFAEVSSNLRLENQPFKKRALDQLLNMVNDEFTYPIFYMFIKFAKEMNDPLTQKKLNERLNDLRIEDGPKRDLLVTAVNKFSS